MARLSALRAKARRRDTGKPMIEIPSQDAAAAAAENAQQPSAECDIAEQLSEAEASTLPPLATRLGVLMLLALGSWAILLLVVALATGWL